MDPKVQSYFDNLPEERRAILLRLHEFILSLDPQAQVLIWYRMPTYRSHKGWVSIANQAKFVSLYTDNPDHLAAYKARHPGVKTGVGSINLKVDEPLPLEDLKEIILSAWHIDAEG